MRQRLTNGGDWSGESRGLYGVHNAAVCDGARRSPIPWIDRLRKTDRADLVTLPPFPNRCFVPSEAQRLKTLAVSEFPLTFRVQQTLAGPEIDDVAAVVRQQLSQLALTERVRPGDRIAISAGSRGIHAIHTILKACVQYLQSIQAVPFIVPAMGSHGGGTAEGQVKVLRSLGITEEYCGCPIQASMDTVEVCRAAEGFPVHFDRHAFDADGVLVVNRIKPHTGFTGDVQSGLMKMMLIGLGKHAGAEIYHRAILDYTFGQIVRSVAREVLGRCKVIGGVAVVENGHDRTALIEGVPANEFEVRERELLKLAQQWMARLPFDEADILLIDEIGKNISGTGMDTNVIGRKGNDHVALGDERPRIRYIVVRGLTKETGGNSSGLGLAEFTLQRVIDQVDRRMTATNCVTANHPTGAMLPVAYDTDHEVLSAVLGSIGLRPPKEARLMWIQNTLQLHELECSEAYWDEAQRRDDLTILSDPRPLPWDGSGGLPPSVFDARLSARSVAR